MSSLRKHTIKLYLSALDEAMARNKRELVHNIMERLRPYKEELASANSSNEDGADESRGWIVIESLSALRKEAGGRFENLKERWLAVGFPLKEHKGDQTETIKIDQKGWEALSEWLVGRGFESKLVEKDEGGYQVLLRRSE